MKILVVEDNVPLGECITHALQKEGHEVVFVQCLRDGVLAVRDSYEMFDLIITDVQLPIRLDSNMPSYGSGLDIVRELRELAKEASLSKPVYVHSSDTHDHGVDIADWLAENYPSATFMKKERDNDVTTQHALAFVATHTT